MTTPLTHAELEQLLQNVRWEGPQHDDRYQMFLKQQGEYLILVVVGKVLQPVPDEFSKRLREVFTHVAHPRVVVDLTRCVYLASAALGFLVDFFHASAASGVRVVMLKPNDRVRAIIGLLGLNLFFTLVETEEQAFATLDAPR